MKYALYALPFVMMAACVGLTPPPVEAPKFGVFDCTPTEHGCTFDRAGKPTSCCPGNTDCGGSPEFPGCSDPSVCCNNGGADSPVDSFGNRRRITKRTPQ